MVENRRLSFPVRLFFLAFVLLKAGRRGSGFDSTYFAIFLPELICRCILAGAPPAGVVLDPFMGGGTTALTALEEGRRFLGIELNPEYVLLSAARINNALRQGIQTKLKI